MAADSTLHLLGKVFAYAARIDGVTAAELDTFSQFVSSRYGPQDARVIHSAFRDTLGEQIGIEEISESIREEFGDDPRQRNSLVLRLLELLLSDGATEPEIKFFDTVCRFLDIRDEDLDLMLALMSRTYALSYPQNSRRLISFGPDNEAYDIRVEACEFSIFQLEGATYLLCESSEGTLYLDAQQMRLGQIEDLSGHQSIRFSADALVTVDLEAMFRLHAEQRIFERYVRIDEAIRVLSHSIPDGFRVRVVGSRIRLDGRSVPNGTVSRSGVDISGTEVDAYLSDELLFRDSLHCHIRVLVLGQPGTITSDRSERDHIVLSGKDDSGDIFVEEPQAEIEIVRRKTAQNYSFKIFVRSISEPVKVGSRVVHSGEMCDVDTTTIFVVGRSRITLSADTGSVDVHRVAFDYLEARDVLYKHPNGAVGIDHITFRADQGDLVAVMGSSGAGKTTLFTLLLGYLNPSSGSILVNGHDFNQVRRRIQSSIGYVPQDDLLFDNLTVEENLRSAARIKMPYLGKDAIADRVEQVLRDVGLIETRNLVVGSPTRKVLSGGQRKRLNIGIELLSQPDLFLLDEPTSGLSSKDAETVVRLLRMLADSGKIVLTIVHQPSSELYRLFDKLLVLDVGGRLAYYGNAQAGLEHFSRFLTAKERHAIGGTPSVIFDAIEKRELGPDGSPLYEQSHAASGKRSVPKLFTQSRSPLRPKRRYRPEYWEDLFRSEHPETLHPAEREAQELPVPPKPRRLRVTLSLCRRALLDKISDPVSYLVSLGLPVVLGVVLGYLFRGADIPYAYARNAEFPKFLFLSAVIFTFFGFVEGIGLVVRERPILLRERLIDVRPWQYVFSKFAAFAPFGLAQVALFLLASLPILGMPPRTAALSFVAGGLPYLYILFVGFCTSFAAFSAALFISTLVSSVGTAFNIVPFLVIPQIVLGGMIIDFTNLPPLLNRHVPLYSNMTFARWSYEALLVGSVELNSHRQARNVDRVAAVAASDTDRSIGDYRTMVREVFDRLRTINSPPSRITRSLYSNEIHEEARRFFPQYLDALESSYILTETVAELTSDEYRDQLRELFTALDFGTGMERIRPNASSIDLLTEAQTAEWLRQIDEVADGTRRAGIVRGENVFPGRIKLLGSLIITTLLFNPIVLLLFGIGFHLLTVLRL
ncbi:MAG: ATP-binding cassette domain-containing protein [Spirochaetaceae bacterium]|nr:MAG: ATP-binding cassette domain-containing protein [Spirochaetaceae bacterium]